MRPCLQKRPYKQHRGAYCACAACDLTFPDLTRCVRSVRMVLEEYVELFFSLLSPFLWYRASVVFVFLHWYTVMTRCRRCVQGLPWYFYNTHYKTETQDCHTVVWLGWEKIYCSNDCDGTVFDLCSGHESIRLCLCDLILSCHVTRPVGYNKCSWGDAPVPLDHLHKVFKTTVGRWLLRSTSTCDLDRQLTSCTGLYSVGFICAVVGSAVLVR